MLSCILQNTICDTLVQNHAVSTVTRKAPHGKPNLRQQPPDSVYMQACKAEARVMKDCRDTEHHFTMVSPKRDATFLRRRTGAQENTKHSVID